jgi:hypothetical protein
VFLANKSLVSKELQIVRRNLHGWLAVGRLVAGSLHFHTRGFLRTSFFTAERCRVVVFARDAPEGTDELH